MEDASRAMEEIKRLEQESIELRRKREALTEEAKNWLTRREAFNKEFKKLKEKAASFKAKRDEANKEVKTLKEERDALRREEAKKREELNALRERLKGLPGKLGDYARTKAKIDELEWRIQTSPLSKEGERALVERVRDLEAKLSVQKLALELKEKMKKLKEEISLLSSRGDEAHRKLIERAKESEVYHVKMLKLLEEAKKVKGEADEAHRNYIKAKKELSELQMRYIECIAKIKGLERRMMKQKEVKEGEEAAKSALRKLKEGKRISLDEFKILMEKGAI